MCLLNVAHVVVKGSLVSTTLRGVGNLQHSGQMRPALTFDMTRIKIFVTEVTTPYSIASKQNSKICRYFL